MLFLFFVYSVLSQVNELQCCKYQTNDGLINLEGLSQHYFDIKPYISNDHEAVVRFCANLDEAHACKGHTETVGPTPMKDEEEQGTCYYIGDISTCTISEYQSTDKTFKIHMTGIESEESPPQKRSVQFLMKCDNSSSSEFGTITDCTQTTIGQHETLTSCQLITPFACPGYKGGGKNFFEWGMGVGGIILIVLFCLIILYLIVGVIVFIVRKSRSATTGEELEFRQIILFDKIVLGFFVLVWSGILLVVETVQFLFNKIFKKGEYSSLE